MSMLTVLLAPTIAGGVGEITFCMLRYTPRPGDAREQNPLPIAR